MKTFCVEYEKWEVTEYRGEYVFNTRLVSKGHWFRCGHGPACNRTSDGVFWLETANGEIREPTEEDAS